jgi:hypothetical protein
MNYFVSEFCPKCKKENLVYTGYAGQDCTGLDIDGIECYNCGNKWLLEPPDDDIIWKRSPENAEYGEGMEMPIRPWQKRLDEDRKKLYNEKKATDKEKKRGRKKPKS